MLCHLEGKSHEEAARLLRWPVGTVSSRLSRGRRILRSRLERRGLTAPSAIFAANWLAGTPTTSALPLLESTVTAAIGFAAPSTVSAVVLALTQGVLRTMWLRKLGTIAMAVLIFGAASGGIAVWAHWPSATARSYSPGRDAGSSPQRVQPPAGSQPVGTDVRLTDCPADNCPASTGDLPAHCPIAMAANAFSRMLSHFQNAEGAAR